MTPDELCTVQQLFRQMVASILRRGVVMFLTKFRRSYRLRNIRTMQKIIGSFCIICLLMGALGSVGIWTTSQMQAQITAIDAADVPKLSSLTTVRSARQSIERDYMQATLEPDAQLWRIEMEQVTQDQATMQQALSQYLHFDHTPAENAEILAYQRVYSLWDTTLQSLQHLAAPNGTNNAAIIDLINEQWQPQSLALQQILLGMSTTAQERVDNLEVRSRDLYYHLLWLISSGIALAFFVAIALGWMIARQISRPLVQLVYVANRVASGNLAAIDDLMMRYAGEDEVGQLLTAFSTMLTGLRQLISRVRATSQSIADASNTLGVHTEAVDSNDCQILGEQDNQLMQAAAEIDAVERLSTELATAYHTIHKQAITDSLTGLPNHRTILEQLDIEIARARPENYSLAVIFFDGDRFKSVNDTFGHAVGDLVLQQLGKRASAVLRASDSLGRYGGEEFMAILPEIDLDQAEAIAERMRAEVALSPLATELVAGGINVTISIGLAMYPNDSTIAAELLTKADQAMYYAKKLGRNQVRTVGEALRAGEELPYEQAVA